jgi:hypothetical protein
MEATINNTAPVNNAIAGGQPVVSNDSLRNSQMAVQGVQATRSAIEQLVVEAQIWHDTAFKSSNDQLYTLLGKCYGLYLAMGSDSEEAKALRAGFATYIDHMGYRFNKGTHTLNKIVKCVFGFDRRRVSAYGIVLRTALANNVSTMDVPGFIRERGGVEEIRLAKSPNAMSPKQKAEVAAHAVVSNQLGVFASPELSAMLDAGKVGTNMVLIATWQADGSVIVRTVVESDTALNAALASHYARNQSAIKAAEKDRAKRDADDAIKQAQAQAAASATVTL